MDPKQTEGQQPGSGTLSTGANISRTMNDLNSNDRKSATFNSPFAKHRFQKVAPQTGDILIDPSRSSVVSSTPSEKKGINRGRLIQFGLIFGGIALIGLVIFTVVMLINQPKKSNGGDSGSNSAQVTLSPESFYSYILDGNTDGKNIPTQRESSKTYALTAALEDSDSNKREYYFSIANRALEQTNIGTLSELADGQLLLEDFAFLSSYAGSPLPDISELTNVYSVSGEAGVLSEVANSYADYDKELSIVKYYIEMADEYAKAFIDNFKQNGKSAVSNEVTTALGSIEDYVLGVARIVEDICININQEQNATEANNE